MRGRLRILALLVGLAACTDEGPRAAPPSIPDSTSDSSAVTAARPTTTSTAELPAAQPAASHAAPGGRAVPVERVVDGDTLVVAGGERVRLIGIDTPESVDPRRGVQCFGREASAHLAGFLSAGTVVHLVADVEATDRYGRTLAYVYRASDGLFVNAALVADGFAVTATYPPNVAHAEELAALATEAREAGRGLWSACGDERGAAAVPAPSRSTGNGCDAAYPDVCIPPAPPDLDCGDVEHRRFRVVPPDPHRFDADGDGTGCER